MPNPHSQKGSAQKQHGQSGGIIPPTKEVQALLTETRKGPTGRRPLQHQMILWVYIQLEDIPLVHTIATIVKSITPQFKYIRYTSFCHEVSRVQSSSRMNKYFKAFYGSYNGTLYSDVCELNFKIFVKGVIQQKLCLEQSKKLIYGVIEPSILNEKSFSRYLLWFLRYSGRRYFITFYYF